MVRKPLTAAHKAKIAARMRRYHNTCKKSSSSATTEKKKEKFVAPKVIPKGDLGAKVPMRGSSDSCWLFVHPTQLLVLQLHVGGQHCQMQQCVLAPRCCAN